MLYVLVGLIGSVLMFCGDMILYYTPEDFDYGSGAEKNKMQAVIDVMKNLPVKRVAIGGLIGPIAAFLSNPWREYSAFYKTGMNRLNF